MRKSISQLNMLSPEEYGQVVRDFNNTAADYPRDKCVHTLFEEQVAKTPDKMAVIACDRTLTYSELNEQANRIAHSLIGKGVKPNDIIAFMLPRKSYLLSVMFGILKSGAAYMPIDPDYPQDRTQYMLQDSGAKFCITEENINEFLDNEKRSNPNVEISSDNLCYCIYTSGSTGKPKGTVLTHKGTVNYISNIENNISVKGLLENNCKSIVSVTTVGFDIFVTESLLPLCNNITVILANETQAKIQSELNSLVKSRSVDAMQTTPTKMKSLIADSTKTEYLKGLKVIILGGEALDEVLAEQLHKLTNAKIFNIYGPTEATVWVSNAEILPDTTPKKESLTLSQIEVLSKTELKTVTKDFNNTAVDYPKDKCVHTLFEEQVAKTPDKVAVIACDRTLTYSELNEQANIIAHNLINSGIKQGDIVTLVLSRNSLLICAMLGVLKAGAAYMPIVTDYPQERIDYMVKDCSSKLVLTDDNISEYANGSDIGNLNIEVSFDYDFCVLHTSGSTGMPKCTALKHINMTNFAYSNKDLLNGIDYVIAINAVTFDVFEMDTIFALLFGNTCVLASETEQFVQKEFEVMMSKYKNCLFWATPTKMQNYIDNSATKEFMKNINCYIVGGEVVTDKFIRKVASHNEDLEIYTVYGPTETLIYSTMQDITFLGSVKLK